MSTNRRLSFHKGDDSIQLEDTYVRQRVLSDGHLSSESLGPKRKCGGLVEFITSRIFVACVALLAVIITLICVSLLVAYEMEHEVVHTVDFLEKDLPEQQKVWFDMGIKELKAALSVQQNSRRARNVILFVGDGMGPNTVTASRIYKGGEGHHLSWELFPHMGLLKVIVQSMCSYIYMYT